MGWACDYQFHVYDERHWMKGTTSYLSVTTGSAWRLWAGEQVMVVDERADGERRGSRASLSQAADLLICFPKIEQL